MSPEDSPVALQAVLVTFLGHLRAGVLTQAPANVGAQVQRLPGVQTHRLARAFRGGQESRGTC